MSKKEIKVGEEFTVVEGLRKEVCKVTAVGDQSFECGGYAFNKVTKKAKGLPPWTKVSIVEGWVK